MKKLMFFLLTLFITTSVFAQPIFVVTYLDTNSAIDNEFTFEGKLVEAEDCNISLTKKAFSENGQLHMLYKNELISIFPKNVITVSDFFYDKEDFDWPPECGVKPIEKPPYTFETISRGVVYSTNKDTDRGKKGKIGSGEVVIQYDNKTKDITVYFLNLKVRWDKIKSSEKK